MSTEGESAVTSLAVLCIVATAIGSTLGATFCIDGFTSPFFPGSAGGDFRVVQAADPPGGTPYYHQIYSATSSNGLEWTVDDRLIFDHASVPGAVVFDGTLYLYFVNATGWPNEVLSVGISEDRGTTWNVHDVTISGSNSPYPVDPNPIIDDGRIRLTYLGNLNPGNETNKIVTATSTDGVNFTEEAVIYTGEVFDPDLFSDADAGEWVLLLNTGGLTRATASSATGPFTVDESFSWDAGSISSTHRIGDRYLTYYAGAGGVSVAEYAGGNLTHIADNILQYPGPNADPTVAVFGEEDYLLFFKTQVESPEPEPTVTVTPTPDPSIIDDYRDPTTGEVEKEGAVQAVNDYLFEGIISRDEAILVVNSYLFG
ncbi:MAG: hypothetical protein ACP5C4_05090 [Methanomicrobiales archaeon]